MARRLGNHLFVSHSRYKVHIGKGRPFISERRHHQRMNAVQPTDTVHVDTHEEHCKVN
ncbi:hypothetical protein M404DRAFT_1006447 [Pisolithus tinctorius Marx 270]|uniref:Uncharacterized protein n=1 Tax=Pisolithus tinctorius Marx 270 TaxID=870435 RepID=A0A0C3NNS6_PISTI|nr:hypothetical protein M404DRAFT_1006447 [Pisolithus tinctorius Marx 270]